MSAVSSTTHRGADAHNDVILSVSEESFRGGTVILAVHSVTTLPPLRDPSLTLRMTWKRRGALIHGLYVPAPTTTSF